MCGQSGIYFFVFYKLLPPESVRPPFLRYFTNEAIYLILGAACQPDTLLSPARLNPPSYLSSKVLPSSRHAQKKKKKLFTTDRDEQHVASSPVSGLVLSLSLKAKVLRKLWASCLRNECVCFVSDNMHSMMKRFQFNDAMFGHSDLITIFFCTSFCMFPAFLACLGVSLFSCLFVCFCRALLRLKSLSFKFGCLDKILI